ncbi:MAG: MucB/RseB C-terminal domain-containing protein [Gammaproteobacteria bacterium]|nr:MucB/RseB C-terminal domain-containing protein [Gammaproteobacteria bacterium]
MPVPARTVLLLLGLWPLVVQAAGDPLSELRRMADAVSELNYEGTFVYEHDGYLQTLHLVHQVDADGEREHLVSLDGDRREVVRDRDQAICILEDGKPYLLDRFQARGAFPGPLSGDLEGLLDHYRLALGERSRVAGRPTRILSIEPRDDLRYGYRLWLDDATGLPLRSELVAPGSGVLERVVFTEFEVYAEADPDRAAAIRVRKAQVRAMIEPARYPTPVREPRWEVSDLPSGFALADYRTYTGEETPVDHLVYSDGLATVSVYVEPTGDEAPMNGTHRSGAVSTFALVQNRHQVVVIGDVPMATAHIIGVAVNPLDDGR